MARYFTEQEFKDDFDLQRVETVLNQLYKEEDLLPNSMCSIEFFIMSDKLTKLEQMEELLEEMGADIDSIEKYEDGCELIAMSQPMLMQVSVVKDWYSNLWKEGYKLDCKLDGWHILAD